MNNQIEQALDSREVAEMVEKDHKNLMRDIRRYLKQFNESNIAPVDFFRESTYEDSKGEKRPCYCVTKKGCEFIAHKLTGTKGTAFTARYINRFHEMQDMITQAAEQKPAMPWFVKKLKGEYVVLERDFIQLTGVDIRKYKGFYSKLKGGTDFNGIGWKPDVDEEQFRQKYGFEYGDEQTLIYFYLHRVEKALDILTNDRTIHMNPEAYKILTDGIARIQKPESKVLEVQKVDAQIPAVVKPEKLPKQISISIVLGDVAEVEVR